MADEDTATELDEPEEITRVRAYRLRRLREFGYEEAEARMLSEEGVDVHFVQSLIAHGATLEEAARIAR